VQEPERSQSVQEPGSATLAERLRSGFGFTKTEARVVSALTEGLSYAEIAEKFGVSYHTVHTHIKAIHRKAGVSTTGRLTALVRCALEHR
jgi:DNA-binding CsgD family transcriptional regulator